MFAFLLDLLGRSPRSCKSTPRLRVAPPYLIDANLARHEATLALSGCAADSDPAPPWSHSVQAPGATSCTLTVRWDASKIVYPALLDPPWTATQSLATARYGHAAGRLNDGTVLPGG